MVVGLLNLMTPILKEQLNYIFHNVFIKSKRISLIKQISQWNDLSGNARHMVQGNSVLQPTWISSNSVECGAVQFTSEHFVSYIETIAQPISMYTVFKHNTSVSCPVVQNSNSNKFYQTFSTGELEIVGNTGVNTTPTIAANTYFLGKAIFNSTSSSVQINDTTTATGDITQTGNFIEIQVGAFQLGTGTNTIKAIYIYATASPDDSGIKAYILYKFPGLY